MGSRNVPDVPALVVNAITKMLIEDRQLNKPPEKAAHLLAIICKLYEQQAPFPKRREVAEKLHSPVATVDAALSTRLDEGYIFARIETKPGHVKKRNSVVRERYYDPSEKLFTVYRQAKRQGGRDFGWERPSPARASTPDPALDPALKPAPEPPLEPAPEPAPEPNWGYIANVLRSDLADDTDPLEDMCPPVEDDGAKLAKEA